jgi:hypothetical protein
VKYLIYVIPFFLSSCFGGSELLLVQGLSNRKQKQKIAFLQKRLKIAEQGKLTAERAVEELAREIDEAELTLIRRQLNAYEKREEKHPNLFAKEREALYRMIQTGPSPSAFEAQVELDRILRMITELSDEEKYAF